MSASRLVMAASLARDLGPFLSTPVTAEAARATVRRQLEERETDFLGFAARAIYGHAPSPYLPLLRAAGCELGDLEALVRRQGLDAALATLRDAGVYVTFSEFKGRVPIARGGAELAVSERAFDNPLVSAQYVLRTGGTRGVGSLVQLDLRHLAARAVNCSLMISAYGLGDAASALWASGGFAVVFLLIYAKVGLPFERWFSFLPPHAMPLAYRLGTSYVRGLARLAGSRLPRPELTPFARAADIARWAAERQRGGRHCVVVAFASSAVRVAQAARELGVRLDRTALVTVGEPLTPARRASIEASGARVIPRYGFTEGGVIGYGCLDPAAADDLHLFSNSLALIRMPRLVTGTDERIASYLFTALRPDSPKVLLNTEIGDFGEIVTRRCGCPLEAAGLTTHLTSVRSFEKLTGEGVTFVGSDLLRILEEALPARFGGSVTDYQLAEEDDRAGLRSLTLLIDPRLPGIDEAEVVRTLLDGLARGGDRQRVWSRMWTQAGTIRVRRATPLATGRGKILQFHLEPRRGTDLTP
jgi:hypothetical protein